MQIQVLTLFPELLETFSRTALLGRAIENKTIDFSVHQLRDFAINRHGQVDDTPYGGGSGMVLRVEAADAAIKHAKAQDANTTVVLCTPRGKQFSQTVAQELLQEATSKGGGLTFICPRYEGIDQRACKWVDHEISVGDYIVMGGEVPAMNMIESVVRLIPEVLGNPESASEESFSKLDKLTLLEYPQYTKPAEYEGDAVPEILLSGDHHAVAQWRIEQRVKDTILRRPDLFDQRGNDPLPKSCDLSVALIHFPVVDKNGEIVTSSITNLDLHDIARSCRTYGIDKFYVVHPTKTLRRLAQRILEHWDHGYGSTYNPNRKDALSTIALMPEFEDVIADIEARTKKLPEVIVTSARNAPGVTSYEAMRGTLRTTTTPQLLLFGTGWGMADELMNRANTRLAPICGPTEYNHLSVRSAAAIIFDRLLG